MTSQFLLFVLSLLRHALPKRWSLKPTELALLYAFMTIGNAVAGVEMLQVLAPMTAYPTPENEWHRLFLPSLPRWWCVLDRDALPFFLGLILGEFSVGSLWSLIGLIAGQPMYAFKNW